MFDPFKKIAFDAKKSASRMRASPTAAVAVGLALRKARSMIKVNLLTVERKGAKKKIGGFQLGQKLIAVCSLILVAAALFIGWRYWTLDKESKELDARIANARTEVARLQSIIAEVQQFEQRSQELQQRVSLIEQLRRDQTGPVHMLDQVSRALPPMLWLIDMNGHESERSARRGRCTT